MVTMLNNGAEPVFPGDMLEWTLTSEKPTTMAKRTKTGPRRVGIQVASPTSERVIGRCLTFAKPVRYDLMPFLPFCLCSRLPLCVPAQMETFDLCDNYTQTAQTFLVTHFLSLLSTGCSSRAKAGGASSA